MKFLIDLARTCLWREQTWLNRKICYCFGSLILCNVTSLYKFPLRTVCFPNFNFGDKFKNTVYLPKSLKYSRIFKKYILYISANLITESFNHGFSQFNHRQRLPWWQASGAAALGPKKKRDLPFLSGLRKPNRLFGSLSSNPRFSE